jgi:hypothetical protein
MTDFPISPRVTKGAYIAPNFHISNFHNLLVENWCNPASLVLEDCKIHLERQSIPPKSQGYQVKSRAQKADGQKADINNPIKQKAEMQKADMSKSRYVKKPTIKKPICRKADILLIFFS